MSVKNFKFVSPGVFINEIDNSFLPATAENIGPVVIGRAKRGLAMQPVKISSYSDYVTVFGGTVPGNGGGDVFRDGNLQSPMYGTYAAKAFLRANVAPLTYIRLLGQETSTGNAAGGAAAAGWKTDGTPTNATATNGGAFGLFVFHSGTSAAMSEGHLGAVWYVMNGGKDGTQGGQIYLSGAMHPGLTTAGTPEVRGTGVAIASDSNGLFTLTISGSQQEETIKFNFDDSSENFVRKKFNTNPQLANKSASLYYPSALKQDYWLGESYEQVMRAASKDSGVLIGVLMPLGLGGTGTPDTSYNPSQMKGQASREAIAGWFIGQDTGNKGQYEPQNAQKLFRLIGRGHGEWLNNNAKVSIERIKQSTSKNSKYGSFSVVLREISDTDQKVVVLERFDNCNIDPKSPNFVGRKIGTRYNQWDATNKRLREYGDYPNMSKYVYVDLNADVEAGAAEDSLLPFGYYGAPVPVNQPFSGSDFGGQGAASNNGAFIIGGTNLLADQINDGASTSRAKVASGPIVSGSVTSSYGGDSPLPLNCMSGTFVFPTASLRVSASDGAMKDPTNAYFGFSSARTATSTRGSDGLQDYGKLWYPLAAATDLTSGGYVASGVGAWSFIFSMDDITPY